MMQNLCNAIGISEINLCYLPETDVATADFKAKDRNAVAAMLGTVIQSIVEQNFLTAEEILTIYVKVKHYYIKQVYPFTGKRSKINRDLLLKALTFVP